VEVSVGCEGSGNVSGCGEGLVCILVGVVRLSPRERANRKSELCGY
jgi:hypothetical protein